jgi:hypothetical protein
MRGAGPIRLGMTLSEVRRVLGDRAAHLEGNTPEVALGACAYLESKSIPKHLGFMFASGRVVRVDVSGAGIRIANGAGVGDTEEKIKHLYPAQITVEPHQLRSRKGPLPELLAQGREARIWNGFRNGWRKSHIISRRA